VSFRRKKTSRTSAIAGWSESFGRRRAFVLFV
jgi:hypothetical protein